MSNDKHDCCEECAREHHGATSAKGCIRMAARFKAAGRRVKLVEIEQLNNHGSVLRARCHFEGPDADESVYANEFHTWVRRT